MKIKHVRVKIDLEQKSSFHTKDLIKLFKETGKIHLIPNEYFLYIKELTEDDPTLNYKIFWIKMLDLYERLISNFNTARDLQSIIYNYLYHIKNMFKREILHSRGKYVAKSKSFNYKFKHTKDYCFIVLSDNKNNKLIDIDPNIHVSEIYKDVLLNAEIDIDKAIFAEYQYSQDIENFVHRVYLIFRFLDRRFLSSKGKTRRIFSSFTSLTSVSRKYVTYKGKYFYELDLSNAQPTLLCNYLISKYGKNGVDENYIEDTANGKLYESIQQYARDNDIISDFVYDGDIGYKLNKYFNKDGVNRRDDVKKLCYQNIFFSQNENTNTFKIFKELYPITYHSLQREINYFGDGETLALKLQNLEADIFLNINPDCPHFTCHDAIYFNDLNLEDIIHEKIRENMDNDNFTLSPEKGKLIEQDKDRIDYDIKTEYIHGLNIFLVEDKTRKQHKAHKVHKSSDRSLQLSYEAMKLKEAGLKAKDIQDKLKISSSAYFRYVK